MKNDFRKLLMLLFFGAFFSKISSSEISATDTDRDFSQKIIIENDSKHSELDDLTPELMDDDTEHESENTEDLEQIMLSEHNLDQIKAYRKLQHKLKQQQKKKAIESAIENGTKYSEEYVQEKKNPTTEYEGLNPLRDIFRTGSDSSTESEENELSKASKKWCTKMCRKTYHPKKNNKQLT